MVDEVENVAIGGSQRNASLAHLAAIGRASELVGAPAVVGDDAADNEGYIVVDCVAVKGG